MTIDEVKAVCKELELVCNKHESNINEWYIYTPNCSMWIACYYHLFAEAVIYNSGLPMTNNKDEFKEGLLRKLKQLKEESIKERINSLEKDFE